MQLSFHSIYQTPPLPDSQYTNKLGYVGQRLSENNGQLRAGWKGITHQRRNKGSLLSPKQMIFGTFPRGGRVVELAVMVDYKAYTTYNRMFRNNRQKVVNMILAVINGVQALYHFQSLGRELTIRYTIRPWIPNIWIKSEVHMHYAHSNISNLSEL